MGCEGVRAAVAALNHRPVERRVDTGVVVVTRDNLDSPDVQRLLAPASSAAAAR